MRGDEGATIGAMPYRVITLFLPLYVAFAALAGPKSPEFPRFADAVDAEKYPSARAPEAVPVLHWRFNAKRDYRYKFQQTSAGRVQRFGSEGETDTKSTAAGDLIVRSQGDGSARLVLENVKVQTSFGVGKEARDLSQDQPTAVLGAMREDGTVESSAPAQQALVKLLFPLPPRTLGVGDSVDLPIDIPFNAMGSALPAKGRTRLTNAGWVLLGKRLCIEFRGDTTFDELSVPEEIAGKYRFAMMARSAFFFDPTEQRFVRGVIAISTLVDADVPVPASMQGLQKDQAGPQNFKMSMVSDDLVVISSE